MDAPETQLLTRFPWVDRRKLTVAEYYRMAEAGILSTEERIELIEGQIIAMTPIGSHHSGTVNMLTRSFVTLIGNSGVVSVQNPVRLGEYSEPEPDFAVLKPREDDYYGRTPEAADVLLLVEIAESSLAYDRGLKRPLYARHGIPEFWIVDIAAREVEVCRTPTPEDYADISRAGRDAVLEPALLPGIAVPAALFLR